MAGKLLNNFLLLHTHKGVTDSIDLLEIAKEFIVVCQIDERKNHFGSFPL